MKTKYNLTILSFLMISFITFCAKPKLSRQTQTPIPKNMVFVEGGRFYMGSNKKNSVNLQKMIKVDSFYMGIYEVTVGDFRKFVKDTGYLTTAENNWGAFVRHDQKEDANWNNPYFKQGLTYPVVCVSWYDTVTYCNWRSKKEGLTQCYKIDGDDVFCDFGTNGYRLPTEAEWEYAARGGKMSKGYTYSGSNNPGDVAWNYHNSGETTHPVGKKKANEIGIYDMSGNANEWCWDWFRSVYRKKRPTNNPKGPLSGRHKILRGGSFCSSGEGLYPVYNGCGGPAQSFDFNGFRIVRTKIISNNSVRKK